MEITTQLDSARSELREGRAAVVRLAETVGEEAWITRPRGGGWSGSECVAHLTLTTEAYLPLLDEARVRVESGTALPRRYTLGVIGWLLAKSLEPPARGRTRTLAAFVPGGIASRADSVAAFTRSQDALLAWLDAAAHVPLNRMIVASPFNRRVRYNAWAAFRVLASHQRRHIWQAERATRGVP
jgi:hypothetical protein